MTDIPTTDKEARQAIYDHFAGDKLRGKVLAHLFTNYRDRGMSVQEAYEKVLEWHGQPSEGEK